MNYLISKFKTNKPLFILFGLQIIFVIFSFIYFISENQLRNSFMSLLTLLLIPAYLGVEKILKIKFGYGFLCLVIFLTLGGIILGPCYDLYMHIPIFDDILHLRKTLSPRDKDLLLKDGKKTNIWIYEVI